MDSLTREALIKQWLDQVWLNRRFAKPFFKDNARFNSDIHSSHEMTTLDLPDLSLSIEKRLFRTLCKQGDIEEASRFLVCNDDRYLHYAYKFAKKRGYTDIQRALGTNTRLNERENEVVSLTTDIIDAILKDREKDLSAHSNLALRFACEYGKLGLVVALLRDHRVTPCSTSLKLAVLHGYSEIVKRILGHPRLVINERERIEILLYAFQTENQKVISSLLSHPLFSPVME